MSLTAVLSSPRRAFPAGSSGRRSIDGGGWSWFSAVGEMRSTRALITGVQTTRATISSDILQWLKIPLHTAWDNWRRENKHGRVAQWESQIQDKLHNADPSKMCFVQIKLGPCARRAAHCCHFPRPRRCEQNRDTEKLRLASPFLQLLRSGLQKLAAL